VRREPSIESCAAARNTLVDALFHAAEPTVFTEGHPKVRRSFEDSRATERDYSARRVYITLVLGSGRAFAKCALRGSWGGEGAIGVWLTAP